MARKRMQKRNYQDKFAEQEYKKGEMSEKDKIDYGARKKRAAKDFKGIKTYTQSVPVDTGDGNKNDISWHKPNEELFKGAFSTTINVANGNPIIQQARGNWPTGGNRANITHADIMTPGVLVLQWIPSIGEALDSDSPVTTAMQALKAYIRQDKSGTPPYDSPDLGMFILAMDSAFAYFEKLCRIYGIARNYSAYDKYTPDALLASLGVSQKSVRDNLANFRNYINDFALRLAPFSIPNGIKYIARHMYLNRNIFLDSNTHKAQYYAFDQVGFWQWVNPTADYPLAKLTLVKLDGTSEDEDDLSTNLLTVQNLMDFGDALLKPLKENDDIGIMTADLLTRFGGNGVVTVGTIQENYAIEPVYDEEALVQIENCFIYDHVSSFSGEITQVSGIGESYLVNGLAYDPSYLKNYGQFSNPGASPWVALQMQEQLMNFHHDDITADDICTASWLLSAGVGRSIDEDAATTGPYYLAPHGSEIVASAKLYFYNRAKLHDRYSPLALNVFQFNTIWFNYAAANYTNATATNVAALALGNMAAIVGRLAQLSKFDWHPRIQVLSFNTMGTSATTSNQITDARLSDVFVDLDNFAMVTPYQLEQMHRVSLLGLLICRDMGDFSTAILTSK